MDKSFTKYFRNNSPSLPYMPTTSEVGLIVVIPVYLEVDYIYQTLQSLFDAESPTCNVEVVLVVNYGETDSEANKQIQLLLFNDLIVKVVNYSRSNFTVSVMTAFDLNPKVAGAGAARKVGMDYAAHRFCQLDKLNGCIVSLDADCAVHPNYFVSIERAFANVNCLAATLYFEHEIQGTLDEDIYMAIIEYELHLRYYLQALKYCDFPYAFHTIGSGFAVSLSSYIKSGGMTRKQAGEDFYFLQKVFPLGGVVELNSTCVYPSSRASDRVPFGTGPSIIRALASNGAYQTYNLQAFFDLKELFAKIDELYLCDATSYDDFLHLLSGRMRSYLVNSKFWDDILPVLSNCATLHVFKKRFFEVFNAFRIVKYLNYTHEHFLVKCDVFDASLDLLDYIKPDASFTSFETRDLLDFYRLLEKKELP